MRTNFCTLKQLRVIFFGLTISLTTPTVLAQPCSTTVLSDDALRFTPGSIEIPRACQTFTVTLNHTGRLPKLAMGHNRLLAKLSDVDGVSRTGMLAGADHDYVDPQDSRVIAHTRVIGGGESTSVTFEVSKLSAEQRYGFVCTFAGHSPIMRGVIVLK